MLNIQAIRLNDNRDEVSFIPKDNSKIIKAPVLHTEESETKTTIYLRSRISEALQLPTGWVLEGQYVSLLRKFKIS